ncbi:MAG: sensor domain-containing diguanylate cyclase [Treponema sp.]|nr:sensor domain-containing diguanylate cyclase [Treponema sp.]
MNLEGKLQSEGLFSNRILALLDVINANGLGLWEISGGIMTLDQKTSEIIGLEGDNLVKLDDIIDLVHEEDRQEFKGVLDTITDVPNKNAVAECRICSKKTNVYSWVRIMGKSYLHQGNMVILGTSQLIEGRALDVFNAMLDNITKELNRKDELNKCIFDITEILLNADETSFDTTFQTCLEIIAHTVGLCRLYIYKNHLVEGTACCTEIHEWVDGVEVTLGEDYTKDIPIHTWPGLEDVLSGGHTYNKLLKDTPLEIQEMTPKGIGAVLFAPIFLRDLLWGFVGYEWAEEKLFSADEAAILCSAGLLLANSLIRNDLNKNLYLAVDKINTTTIKAEVLEKFAYTDTLTGIYNRRHFMELAQNPLDKAKRFGKFCYAMIMDLDFFKKVNDTYGHLAGDEVLKNAANVMKNTLRSYDLLCRYGGEEFVVLVAESTKEASLNLAERIREAIVATPCVYNVLKIPVTMSIGVAESFPDCTIESLIDRADKALYMAKEQGRNRVVFYTGEEK